MERVDSGDFEDGMVEAVSGAEGQNVVGRREAKFEFRERSCSSAAASRDESGRKLKDNTQQNVLATRNL